MLSVEWTEGRVRRIRILHETTDFMYAGSTTTATSLLGWSTSYRRADSGMTESITDRTGVTTEVAFDADHRPVTVTRDGSMVARIGYDDEGRLATLSRPEGETTFTNSRRGVTAARGGWSARYRYSDLRVVYARDARGERSYRYADDGSLAGATVDGVDTELCTNTDGTLTEVSRKGQRLVSYVHAPDGRVSTIDYGNGRTAAFVYDMRGLRTTADYTYVANETVNAAMTYDAVGNLTRIERSKAGAGEASEQTYTIGDYNEVLGVRTVDGRDPGRRDLTFGYDAAGRIVRAAVGKRSATVEYDALDRATRVVVDGGTVLEEAYGADDDDAVAREDRRTGGVLVAARLSPIFGTMESIVYARPRTAEFGVVAYSPARKTFEVRLDALAADAVLLSSLEGRMAPLAGGDPNPAPFGHDKPSNRLFVPPEFRSVNCELCTGAVFDVYLTVTPAPAYCPTSYSAVVDGFCQKLVGGLDDNPISIGIPLPWLHSTDFGDGMSSGIRVTSSTQVDGTHAYGTAGTYTMTHSALCTCPSAFAFGSGSRTFAVPGGNVCTPPRCSLEIVRGPGSADISVVPNMPGIGVTATNVVPADATVSWTARMVHRAPGTCSGGPDFRTDATAGAGTSFEVYFGYGVVVGGDLEIFATCAAPGYESETYAYTAAVNGTQPTDDAIIAEIGTLAAPFDQADLRRIGCHESSLTQFSPSPGAPLYGPGGDAGIMQICWRRTAADLWNWRSNVARGRTVLEEMKGVAADWLDGEMRDHEEATPYGDERLRREAIHRYNAGNGGRMDAYWEWVDGKGWTRIQLGGAAGYVQRVLGQGEDCR